MVKISSSNTSVATVDVGKDVTLTATITAKESNGNVLLYVLFYLLW